MIRDFGYPFGKVALPWWDVVLEIDAACDADDHNGHPFCDPTWRDRVNAVDGWVVAGPILVNGVWKALVFVGEKRWIGPAKVYPQSLQSWYNNSWPVAPSFSRPCSASTAEEDEF